MLLIELEDTVLGAVFYISLLLWLNIKSILGV